KPPAIHRREPAARRPVKVRATAAAWHQRWSRRTALSGIAAMPAGYSAESVLAGAGTPAAYAHPGHAAATLPAGPAGHRLQPRSRLAATEHSGLPGFATGLRCGSPFPAAALPPVLRPAALRRWPGRWPPAGNSAAGAKAIAAAQIAPRGCW